MIMWFLFWSYHIQTHSCRLLYLGKKTTLAQIHTFLQVRYSFALVRSLSLSFYLSATTIRLRMSVCVFFFLALFFYCDCCDCLLFGLFSTFIVLFLSFEFCDFIRQIQSDIHHTHQNKLNKVYSCRNNKYFILSLFLLYLLLFFLLLNSFIDRLSKSSNCHSASVFIYVCCSYCLCLVLFAPLTEIWKYALQSWRVQWTSNCSRLKNVCTCVCRSYFSSCINSSCILFALLTLWLSSVTLHRFFSISLYSFCYFIYSKCVFRVKNDNATGAK